MSNRIECVWCHGAGEHTCSTCNGEGKLTCPDCNGKGTTFSICPDCHEGRVLDPMGEEDDDTMPCPTCHGNYKTESGKCKTCGGSGKVECKDCEGKGKVWCDFCEGDGEFDVEAFCADYLSDETVNGVLELVIGQDVADMTPKHFAQLVKIADAGYAKACYIVGCCYDGYCSEGTFAYANGSLAMSPNERAVKIADVDKAKAEKYFRMCADEGAIATDDEKRILQDSACQMIAKLLLDKNQSDERKMEGIEWLQKAAAHNQENALLKMAFISLGGVSGLEGLKKDTEKALSYFKRYIECDPCGSDTIEMVKVYMEKLPKAVNGDTSAILELAKLHERPYHDGPYYDESSTVGITGGYSDLACYWFEKAAAAGNVEAIRKLAEKKEDKHLGDAIKMLSKVAKDDELSKQQLDAVMQGCTKDQSRFDELKEVGKSGNVTVMKFLAKMYNDGVAGKDQKTRLEQATKWMQMAADAGDAESKLDLSLRYRDGKGCQKDVNRSFALIYEGFKAGLKRRALRLFGELYRWGYFAEPDHKKANELYVMSANAGYTASICCIAKSYLEGLGVKKDLCEAKRLFELAVKKGSKDASTELKKIPTTINASKKPISGVMAEGKSVMDQLPGYIIRDYEKAKEGRLWSLEFERQKKARKTSNTAFSQKKRWKFVMLGLFLGIFGLHFLYARRKAWFLLYWLMSAITFAQYKVVVFLALLDSISPKMVSWLTLGPIVIPKFGSVEIPIFGLLAGLTLLGSIIFMTKDASGDTMR